MQFHLAATADKSHQLKQEHEAKIA